ncbi:MAG: hypothetical protein ACXADB_06790 [Candidatus Hermodarchaeia archaeon]
MARVYCNVLKILAVINLVLISLNFVIPLISPPVVGAPTPTQAILIYVYFGTFTWPIFTGLILLLDVFKPGGGKTGRPGRGTT